jgi:hypothetical protein
VREYAPDARVVAPEVSMLQDLLALPSTDWLRHVLIVTGSADEVASFQTASAGLGAIPWVSLDLDLGGPVATEPKVRFSSRRRCSEGRATA